MDNRNYAVKRNLVAGKVNLFLFAEATSLSFASLELVAILVVPSIRP